MYRGTWLGASLSLLLGAGSASAEECPKPYLTTCQQPGYLQSTCGVQHKEVCGDLIREQFSIDWQALELARDSRLPDALGGGSATTHVVPYDTSTLRVEGGGGSYVGMVLKNQLLHRKRFESLSESDQLHLETLKAWEENGKQVGSCQEFVYEKNYDYSRFEDRVGAFGPDFRAIFQAAYADDGIANRELFSMAGTPLPPIFPEKAIEKNLYFRFSPGPYPEGVEPYAFDPELLASIRSEGRRFHVPSFDWNQGMSMQLEGMLDDDLNNLYAQQEAFASLLQRRQRLWAFYESQRQKDTGDLGRLREQVGSQLHDLDKALEAGLLTAKENGCLELEGNPACDWSPRRFKALLDSATLPSREQEFQRCMFLTGNDFSDESFIRNADRLEIDGLAGDYTHSAESVAEYLSRYAQALVDAGKLVEPATREIRKGGERGDHGDFGDGNFGAGYEYAGGWEFISTPMGESCEAHARIFAFILAKARVFGTEHEVFHARAEAGTVNGAFHYLAFVRVLGVDQYHEEDTVPLRFNFGDSLKHEQELFHAETYITVAAVPLHVVGAAVGSIGLDYGLDGGFKSLCEINLHGNVRPWGKLDGRAIVEVDLLVASAGVEGSVTLLDAQLPFDAEIAVFLDPTMSDLMFRLDADLDLTVSTLNGRVVVFVDGFWGRIAEAELAAFSGPRLNVPLLDEHHRVKLADLR
jgi:hypothetical protein